MKKKELKLGLIGLSEGNGHPYSWSAIFNGYNHKLMESCQFPVIPRYLNQRKFPDDCIDYAKVTHIWTQNKSLSEKISKTCYIENIVDDYEDMIGKVDGILLARDDAENHLKMSKPFLLNGLPIYIDKPLALNLQEAQKIIDLQQYKGQMFSCSALKYAEEFNPNKDKIMSLGKLISIDAIIANSWEKYSIHIIEPILNLIPNKGKLINHMNFKTENYQNLILTYENIEKVSISTIGCSKVKPTINIIGENGNLNLKFTNTFDAFKKALMAFTISINHKDSNLNGNKLLEAIKLIELGL
tara:strand:- start:23657 stop:24553 length:897 start_codon:yes stop_codon:yes gene_type:complete